MIFVLCLISAHPSAPQDPPSKEDAPASTIRCAAELESFGAVGAEPLTNLAVARIEVDGLQPGQQNRLVVSLVNRAT